MNEPGATRDGLYLSKMSDDDTMQVERTRLKPGEWIDAVIGDTSLQIVIDKGRVKLRCGGPGLFELLVHAIHEREVEVFLQPRKPRQ